MYKSPSDVCFNKFFSIAYTKIYGKELKEGENFYKILNNEESAELEIELTTDSLKHKRLDIYIFF